MDANEPRSAQTVHTKPTKTVSRLRILCSTFLAAFAVVSNEADAQYTENFQTWSATSADTWQTQSLAGAPFSVPANAVVEIAVRNVATGNQRSGGVRAVGFGLEKRFQLRAAEVGGVERRRGQR